MPRPAQTHLVGWRGQKWGVSITVTTVQFNILVRNSFKKTKFPDVFSDAISRT